MIKSEANNCDKSNEETGKIKSSNLHDSLIHQNKELDTKTQIDELAKEDEDQRVNHSKGVKEGLLVNENDFIQVPGIDIEEGLFTRVVIIGDYFISHYIRVWPSRSNIKPYFIYKSKLSIEELYLRFQNHPFLKNSKNIFVLFVVGLHDLAIYEGYKSPTCCGMHPLLDIVRNIKNCSSLLKRRLINLMLDVKNKLEAENNLSIVFSYIPEFKFLHSIRDICSLSRQESLGCSCICKLGKIPGRTIPSFFRKTIPYLNRMIFNERLNFTEEKGFFEFMPIDITFRNGNWNVTQKTEESMEEFSILNIKFEEFLFDSEGCIARNIQNTKSNSTMEQLSDMKTQLFGKKYAFRILIIGDTWLKCIANMWAPYQKIKPFFYCADNLTLKDINRIIFSIIKNDEKALVITALPSGELLSTISFFKCKNHEPLRYPVPKDGILENPIKYCAEVIKNMDSFLQDLRQHRNNCGVVFLTCYPILFASYYNYITTTHIEANSKHRPSDELIKYINCCDFDDKFAKCIGQLNLYIYKANERNNFDTCDITSLIAGLSESEEFTFPFYIENLCPSPETEKYLFQHIKKYIERLYSHCQGKKFSFALKGMNAEKAKKKNNKDKSKFKSKEGSNAVRGFKKKIFHRPTDRRDPIQMPPPNKIPAVQSFGPPQQASSSSNYEFPSNAQYPQYPYSSGGSPEYHQLNYRPRFDNFANAPSYGFHPYSRNHDNPMEYCRNNQSFRGYRKWTRDNRNFN